MKPIISIIIPVYNVEQYLTKCLDSCINQTFRDIEIIVVNDNSPDNSDKIMQDYEKKYPEIIKCIYLDKNIRQGGARNKGIEIAQGEYILFVDGDDYIACDMCQKLYESACFNNADVVLCDYFRVVNDSEVLKCQFDIKIGDMQDIPKELVLRGRIKPGILCKLCRKKIILENLFPENVYYEDLSVTLVWLLNATKINYIDTPLYYYFSRENSVVCENNYSITLEYAKAIVRLLENFKKSNLYQKYRKNISEHILKEMCDFLCNYICQFLEHGSKDIAFLAQYINKNICDWEVTINNEVFQDYEKSIIRNFLLDNNYLTNLYDKSNTTLKKMFGRNNVVIWGVGFCGKNILNYLKKFDVKPLYVVDSNQNLYSSYLNCVLITSFDNVSNECDVVIVTIKDKVIFGEIKEKIEQVNKNIKIMYYAELFEI